MASFWPGPRLPCRWWDDEEGDPHLLDQKNLKSIRFPMQTKSWPRVEGTPRCHSGCGSWFRVSVSHCEPCPWMRGSPYTCLYSQFLTLGRKDAQRGVLNLIKLSISLPPIWIQTLKLRISGCQGFWVTDDLRGQLLEPGVRIYSSPLGESGGTAIYCFTKLHRISGQKLLQGGRQAGDGVHSFHKYLLSISYVFHTIQGAGQR